MIHALLICVATASIPASEVVDFPTQVPAIEHASAEELAMRIELQAFLTQDVKAMEQSLALYELMLNSMEDGDEIARTRIAAANMANQLGDAARAHMHLVQAQWNPTYGAEAQAALADMDR